MKNNILIVDKEKNISSNHKLMEVKNDNKINKCGFVGTLDPFATGLLLVCCNQYTKLVDYFHLFSKTYTATIIFGKTTSTLDETSEITYDDDFRLNEKDLIIALSKINEYDQVPPMFSAKKVNGKRAYELARKGEVVELKSKRVNIISKKIMSINESENKAVIEFEVTSGTYIRTLADDIAKILGTRAYLKDLRRTKIGDISLETKEINLEKSLSIKIITLENSFESRLVNNGQIPNNYKENINKEGLYNIIFNGKKIALYEFKNKKWKLIFKY